MTRVLRDSDVEELVGFPEAVEVVARGVIDAAADSDDAAAAQRFTARFPGGWLRVMGGTLPGADVLGFKAFHLVPGGVRYLCALYRLSDGEPLALLDANRLTVMRTSAAAAAAAVRHAGDAPLDLAVIGAGRLARDGLRALASVCTIERARVFSPRPDSRERFAAELGAALGIELAAAPSAAAACRTASLILCATETGGTVALTRRDAGDAPYISSVGSTLPSQRELEGELIARAATVVIDTEDALTESGDLIAARAVGLHPARIRLLADHLGSAAPAAATPVIYKSIGSVEQDLALAAAAWRAACERGVGEEIDEIEAPRSI